MSSENTARALAQALHLALRVDVAIAAQLGDPPRLYDHAPEDPIYPYLTYGAMREQSEDGDDLQLSAFTLNLHIWSRYGGRSEVLSAAQALRSVIERRDLDVAGHKLISANVIYSDIFRAPDGRTLHGLLRISIKLSPLMEGAEL